MDRQLVEYYHDRGMMPDRYYHQMNGKTAQENYNEIRNKRFKKGKNQTFIEALVIGMLQSCLQVALKEVMKDILPKK